MPGQRFNSYFKFRFPPLQTEQIWSPNSLEKIARAKVKKAWPWVNLWIEQVCLFCMNGIHPPSDTIWPFGNHSPELPAELLAEAVRLFGLSKGGACGKNIQLKSLRKDMPICQKHLKQHSGKRAFCHDFEGKQEFYRKKTRQILEAFVRIRPRCCHSRCHCCRCWCCRCRRCGLGRRRRRLGRRLWLSRSLASTGADIKNPSFRGFVLEHRPKKWDHFLDLSKIEASVELQWGLCCAPSSQQVLELEHSPSQP